MDEIFQIAGGSVLGKAHYRVKQNNQDSFSFRVGENGIIAVVCDGCGDKTSEHNDFGAKLGVRLIASSIENQAALLLAKYPSEVLLKATQTQWEAFFEKIRQDILAKMRVIALEMGGNFTETVINYFLFTTVGVLVTPMVTVSFSVGDGLVIVNGRQIVIGPFPNNQPPYLGYAFLDPTQVNMSSDLLKFTLHTILRTSELDSFLIGTDGVLSLIRAADAKIPGREELVGSIDQFWTNDHFFTNPFNVTRRLTILNGEKRMIDWDRKEVDVQPGILEDDTTLIVCRREKQT